MFDLPVETDSQRRNYRLFRKYLIESGFVMMQQSIYTKIAKNSSAANAIAAQLRKNKPPEGLVQVLQVTEKQYAKTEVIDTDERLVVL